VITILAVTGLLLFAGITLPQFSIKNLQANSLPNGWRGMFASTPFAIWFFLGIEGVANVAEETINPQRTILFGFGSAIFTLVLLCILTFVSSIGVSGWEAIVYTPDGGTSDSPLPLAVQHIVGNSWVYQLLIIISLFGLVASFHGILLAAGRSSFEFGRVKFAPGFLGKIQPRFRTPANALLINMFIGIVALLTGKTSEIITISVFGALTLYIVSMIALLQLRRKEPQLARPFKVPLYPYFPVVALLISVFSFITMAIYNLRLGIIYLLILGLCFILFKLFKK
jgi:ethanolamine permease